jgi:alanine racemase
MKKNTQNCNYNISKKTWCEISVSALKHNYTFLRGLCSQGILKMIVLKSNAYGHGILECAQILNNLDCDWLAVDDVEEAFLLRKSGIIKPILVLGATLPGYIKKAKKEKITLTCSTFEFLSECQKHGVDIHIKIDTGLSRQGFTENFFSKLLIELKKTKSK